MPFFLFYLIFSMSNPITAASPKLVVFPSALPVIPDTPSGSQLPQRTCDRMHQNCDAGESFVDTGSPELWIVRDKKTHGDIEGLARDAPKLPASRAAAAHRHLGSEPLRVPCNAQR